MSTRDRPPFVGLANLADFGEWKKGVVPRELLEALPTSQIKQTAASPLLQEQNLPQLRAEIVAAAYARHL